jgi:glucokinase
MHIVAGDIGGTKVLLQLCESGDPVRVVATRSYRSQAYAGLEPIVSEFLDELVKDTATPAAACFAVAGPVVGRRAKITNLPWMLDADRLADALGIGQVLLVNDMTGVGHGIDELGAGEQRILQAGEPTRHGVRVIIAAGTGLGQGAMVWQGDRYVMLASEGGHADFAPRDELELELLRYLRARLGQVSVENLLSGRGMTRIYEFLRDTGRAAEPPELAAALSQADDPAAVISASGMKHEAPIASLALDRFARIYGAQAGNLALTFLATGGVFVAGGIAPKIIEVLARGSFIAAFNENRAMSSLLHRVPVHAALCSDLCLRGARRLALALPDPNGQRLLKNSSRGPDGGPKS